METQEILRYLKPRKIKYVINREQLIITLNAYSPKLRFDYLLRTIIYVKMSYFISVSVLLKNVYQMFSYIGLYNRYSEPFSRIFRNIRKYET